MADFDPSKKNKIADAFETDWQRAVDFSEPAPHVFRGEPYLHPHERETESDHQWLWKRRIETLAPRGTLTALGLDVRLGYLFEREPFRTGPILEDENVRKFIADATGGGVSLTQFMKTAVSYALTTGLGDIVVDPSLQNAPLPNRPFLSDAERMSFTRPRVTLFGQLDRPDWRVDGAGNYLGVRYIERFADYSDEFLSKEPEDGPTSVLSFTQKQWARHVLRVGNGGEKTWEMMGPFPTMGEIPIVQIFGKRSQKADWAGVFLGLLTAVAKIDERLLNLGSEIDAAELFVRNLFLWPVHTDSDMQTPGKIGRSMAIGYPADSGQKPSVMDWPTEEIKVRMDMFDQIAGDAMKLLKFTFRLGNPESAGSSSGRHEQLQRIELYKELREWSEKLEAADRGVMRWVMSYIRGGKELIDEEEMEDLYTVRYHDDFILESPEELLEASIKIFNEYQHVAPTFVVDYLARTMEALLGSNHPNYDTWIEEIEEFQNAAPPPNEIDSQESDEADEGEAALPFEEAQEETVAPAIAN